ncbi:uncharacterized protein LOC118749603 [Rhagoletis pomonella]|uniref:uncharacterized protein LOC118749603 n=1 Tax=Rhagoletis pomonella TaxID=28610 RepID=UPI0017805934|nr:uncharacterized protein LOC118749603 [Rhagoletis pomonella]
MAHEGNHATAVRNKLTQSQYASHRLAIREGFSTLHRSQKLFLAWIVVIFTRIEGERLSFIRSQQELLRAEQYLNLHDALRNRAQNFGLRIGKQVIMPKTFPGSYRNLHFNYLNAMSIVREFGKPDLFIKFTCNPNWNEIKSNMESGEHSMSIE